MKSRAKSLEQLIEEQVRQWRFRRSEPPREAKTYPVVTISREPGSGGRIIGEKLAARLNLPLFHQEVMHEMAKSAKVSKRLVETLDERGLNLLEEWLASLPGGHLPSREDFKTYLDDDAGRDQHLRPRRRAPERADRDQEKRHPRAADQDVRAHATPHRPRGGSA